MPNRTKTAPSVPAAALLLREPPSLEECEQEARLRLWQLADRLETSLPANVPRTRRPSRHAAFNVLRLEMRATETMISLEALGGAELIPELADERSVEAEALSSGHLQDQITCPDLAAAFAALAARDRDLLDLHYHLELTDREIAGRLNTTAGAVKKQRQRAIGTLRQALRPKECA